MHVRREDCRTWLRGLLAMTTAPITQWKQVTIPRDKPWKRPLIMPRDSWAPPGTDPLLDKAYEIGAKTAKLIPYTRATTFISCLENTHNLQLWKMRQTAIGLAHRPDLLMLVSSLGLQPEEDDDYREWRSKMDEICEQALEAAESSAPANIGTALHAFTDRIDRGQPLGKVPREYQKHLRAYEAATADLTAVHIERFLVNDEYQIGGTPDRISMLDGHDKLIITDTKSGDKLSYGMGKISMQLAVYAHSQFYDPSTGVRSDIPNIDLERGLVISLNAKRGTCEWVWCDLKAGWEGVELANSVRAWQKRKDFHSPYTPRDLVAEAHSRIVTGIAMAETTQDLYDLWSTAGKVWLPEHSQLAAARKAQLQQQTT